MNRSSMERGGCILSQRRVREVISIEGNLAEDVRDYAEGEEGTT